MKTLQEQYILIKEGKGNKDHFLKQAKNLFPEYINQYSDYNTTVNVLKSKSILSEGIGGVISHKPSPSWLEIFRENMDDNMDMDKVNKMFNFWKDKSREFTKDVKPMMDKEGMTKSEQDEVDYMLFNYEREQDDDVDKVMDDTDIEEILAEVIGVPNRKTYGDYDEFAKPSKQVQKDLADQFDNKDKKNIDNVYGTSFLNGYYAEMKDPKNKNKTVDELKQIVLKNMVKDINYYAKNAMFGTKGVGFKTEKLTIAPKGKYKSSGYGDLPKAKTIKEGIHDRDILSRPSSNPDVTPLKRSPEELGKEADNRSENMLLMKYQKQINDRNITDDELRDILSGQGVKGFGGRKNAIEKIISNRNTN
jgi:hypothetical protein